jgi:Family of unknown function (DUF5684)
MRSLIASSSAGLGIALIFYLGIIVLEIAGMWMVFTKAGKYGWAAIIPFYNTWTMCEVAKRPGWWLILLFIPFVNIVVWFIVAIDLAKAFGKGTGYGVGVALLSFIFIPMLGFGDAQYDAAAPAR